MLNKWIFEDFHHLIKKKSWFWQTLKVDQRKIIDHCPVPQWMNSNKNWVCKGHWTRKTRQQTWKKTKWKKVTKRQKRVLWNWNWNWKMDEAFAFASPTITLTAGLYCLSPSSSCRPSVYTSVSRATFPHLSKIYCTYINHICLHSPHNSEKKNKKQKTD